MSIGGTAAYDDVRDLPAPVARAVELARERDFPCSCRPAQGRLLSVLAAGVGAGSIGETGTGCGVGLAWLASGAGSDATLVSVENDQARAEAAARAFAEDSRVTVLAGDWSALAQLAPFDLLCLDGGGQGKRGEDPIDAREWLRPGGLVVMDDFTPSDTWPPTYEGEVDEIRLHWLTHPLLDATEIRTEPGAATILARLRPP